MKARQENTYRGILINLQLFAEGDPAPQLDPTAQAMQILQAGNASTEGAAPTEGQPQPGEGNPQNSPQSSGQPQQGEPSQTEGQGQPQQAPQGQDALILGKFKSPEELANGYANLEKFNTQTRQELAQSQQQMQTMQQQMQQMQQQLGSVVQPQQQEPQATPEEVNEQFMSSFYENPMAAIQSIIEKAVTPQIQPIQQQYQAQQQQQAWNQAVNEFAQQAPDFQNFQPAMAQILSENPELNNHPKGPSAALNIAYNMAKGQQYQDPNSLLQNQDFVKQNIMGNEDIKNQIIQEYLQSLKQGNQTPTVINGQINGSTPVVPENRPQNMDEARAAALKIMQG